MYPLLSAACVSWTGKNLLGSHQCCPSVQPSVHSRSKICVMDFLLPLVGTIFKLVIRKYGQPGVRSQNSDESAMVLVWGLKPLWCVKVKITLRLDTKSFLWLVKLFKCSFSRNLVTMTYPLKFVCNSILSHIILSVCCIRQISFFSNK